MCKQHFVQYYTDQLYTTKKRRNIREKVHPSIPSSFRNPKQTPHEPVALFKPFRCNAEPQAGAMIASQSTFPFEFAPANGALNSFITPAASSSRKWPPRVRLMRPLNQEAAPRATPMTHPMVRNGCSVKVTRMSKKIFSKLEMVSLGLILGGDAVTLFSVSRMDVRDGMM